ncbi:hypothetical protein [Clostridium sp. HBUAS56010]|uniref:hypothetical protein n=1 Tax=Clostridium sp. HBUAS56010 TaxID=2571127 RepID=UPI00163D6301|nr:hypothetical protein [Clostridium sp. HBUAS56010]
MNMIPYHPKNKEDQKELEKKAAILHSQAVLQYVKQLSCPTSQKQDLIHAVTGHTRS